MVAPANRATDPPEITEVERRLWRSRKLLVALVVLYVTIVNLVVFSFDLRRWDWLLITGALLYLGLLPASLRAPQRVGNALGRLTARAVLQPADHVEILAGALHARARLWAWYGGWVAPPVALGVWLWTYRSDLPGHVVLAGLEIIASVPIGRFVGRAVAYGRLGRALDQREIGVTVTPGHLDGAAGLRPIGDLYLFQASMVGAIAAYLGVWWLITPVFFPRYLVWRNSYLALLVVILACEFLAFLAPMLWFHRRMVTEKNRLLVAKADAVSREASVVEEALLVADDGERPALQERLALLKARYEDIETMPTWPVSLAMRRRFAVQNVVLFLPVVAQALSAPKSWQSVIDGVSKSLSGG
jgi:hypothetical protein